MAALKYSRQRESIHEYLNQSYEHPTADMVYSHVRESFPQISLGTVYRNLNLLTDMGHIIKITTPSGGDRFDAHLMPHNHFICDCCGAITDLKITPITTIQSLSGDAFDGTIESHSTVFFGKCKSCVNQETV